MKQNLFDIIIIGAGAAGMMAALELALVGKKIAVIEAKDRIGGRACNFTNSNFLLPVETGAEFIHGKLEPTLDVLKKGGAKYYKVKGNMWQKHDGKWSEQKDFIEDYKALDKKFKELRNDISVDEFIKRYLTGEKVEETRFTLKNYVEGYYAADIKRASTYALEKELNEADDEQYRIEGGYAKLFNYLHQQCNEKGVQFFLSHPVTKIEWQKNNVEAIANNKTFIAQKILITVPVGVLQSGAISFSPALSKQMLAAKQLGFGAVIKTILQFEEAFWKNKELTQQKDLSEMSFAFSQEVIPTWWTYFPKNVAMLTGWSGGPHAEILKDLHDEDILQKALDSLAQLFEVDISYLRQNLKGWHVANWVKDPYSCGGYSYEVVNGETAKKILKEPVEETIFFAGEGLFEGTEIGTVNAALVVGRDTAHQMIGLF